ncbi:MAG: exosortase-dependent surface protein XDP2 [Verrucomicrobiota bacterium]
MVLLFLFIIQASDRAAGAAIAISNVNVSSLPGSRDAPDAGSSRNNPFRDDVLLESFEILSSSDPLVFRRADGNIRLGTDARVRSGAQHVNAEYGDLDNGSDGNPNPYVKAGLIPEGTSPSQSFRESTDPAIQNPAIASAINTYSINEGIDGEASGYTLDFFFEVGVVDNDVAVDLSPEFLIFERGLNSGIIVEAIVGGTVENPLLSGVTMTVTASDFSAVGIFIDTVEISRGQELGAVGIDLSDILASDEEVYGLRVTSLGNTGADISGIFVTGESPQQFTENPVVDEETVPEPGVSVLVWLGMMAIWRRRKIIR